MIFSNLAIAKVAAQANPAPTALRPSTVESIIRPKNEKDVSRLQIVYWLLLQIAKVLICKLPSNISIFH